MASLNSQQFGEQLRLFGSAEPRHEQLQMNFPPHPRLAPQAPAKTSYSYWDRPVSQRHWNASMRVQRSLRLG